MCSTEAMVDESVAELTTVADDEAVIHRGGQVTVLDGLSPDTAYELEGFSFRTLPRFGELLCRFTTVNDVHFGETECGVLEGFELGPILSRADDEEPYPELMNRCAAAEMAAIDPAAVVVKGDLTARGIREEYDRFLACYAAVFGDRLHHVRGNHDAYQGEEFASAAPFHVELPGVTLAVIDTTIPRHTPGQLAVDQLMWLRDLSTSSASPVLVFGHHHVWSPESTQRPDNYFGIHPDDSERFVEMVAANRNILGYFAGHTHRNRVRRFGVTGVVPFVEVASVKDFPGSWAEYRVFERGVLQIHRRVSDPEALAWTERTRAMYGGQYDRYSFGELSDRCFAIRHR